jgi:hypothetical protein
MDKKSNFAQLYLEAILAIIEDKPTFTIPSALYYSLILFFCFQISGYVWSHYELKPVTDDRLGYLAYIGEVSDFVLFSFICRVKLTMLIKILSNIFTYEFLTL